MSASKRERLVELIQQLRDFRFCGPSDDPDEQTAVTLGYRYLLVQLKRLASPLLSDADSTRLNAIEVEVNNIYSAYDAQAEVDALLPDIESALEPGDVKEQPESVVRRDTSAAYVDNPSRAAAADDRFCNLEKLGEGAYGHVWSAYDEKLKRKVAIKFVRPSGRASQDALAHARALARVEHPNIVTVYDLEELIDPEVGERVPVVVMELIEGVSLTEIFGHHLDLAEVDRIGSCLLAAIRQYHERSLAHIDLHAGNVIVGTGQVKVLDPLYFDTDLISSTASRASIQARDLRALRDLLVQLVGLTDVSLDRVSEFERATQKPTLEILSENFVAAIRAGDSDREGGMDRRAAVPSRGGEPLEAERVAAVMGTCDEQGEGCTAKDVPNAIFATYVGPNRRQTNVCHACTDRLVGQKRWRLK